MSAAARTWLAALVIVCLFLVAIAIAATTPNNDQPPGPVDVTTGVDRDEHQGIRAGLPRSRLDLWAAVPLAA